MRFMVLVKASEDSEAGVLPTRELLAEMGKFNEEMATAGVMLAGEGLHASSKGAGDFPPEIFPPEDPARAEALRDPLTTARCGRSTR